MFMDYLPRFLMSTRPPGDDVYEVLVTGVDSVGVLNKLTGVLSESQVNFISTHGQVDEAGKTFINVFFCEMGRAKASPDELRKRLTALPFVREVRIASIKGVLHERFMFPNSMLSAGRALIVGSSAFKEMEDRLVEMFGSAGQVMTFEQGRAYASSTLRDLEKYRERVKAEWDIENIQGLIREQGWGVVTIRERNRTYEVTVESPPANGDGEASATPDRFLVGMIVGLLERHSGVTLQAEPVTPGPKPDAFVFKARQQGK